MRLNIWSFFFFLAKLVSLEVKRLPNAADFVLPKSFCQLTAWSICWWDWRGPGPSVWLRFGGNCFLLELCSLSMCKTHSRVWVLKLGEKCDDVPEIDGKAYIGSPWKKKALYLKAGWETTGSSRCPWGVCWPFGSKTAPNRDETVNLNVKWNLKRMAHEIQSAKKNVLVL